MKNIFLQLITCLLCLITLTVQAQDKAIVSGSLQANGNFFQRDSVIGAANTPQYDRQLYGADVWMNLSCSYKGYEVGLRFDMFNNSNLLNPTGSYTDQGVGRWYAKKKFNKLGVSAGYLYDQIGSGIIYRAYEQRPLLIDQALYGLRLTYDFTPDWQLKAFTGRQKQQFDLYDAILRGGSIEGFVSLSDTTNFSIAPGLGVVARTIGDETMDKIVTSMASYLPADRSIPKYNTYAASLYNTLSVNNITWYAEAAFKSNEVFFDPTAKKQQLVGDDTFGKLVSGNGLVLYTTMSWAKKGFGVNLEAKRTVNFDFRTDPLLRLNNGLMNFIPPMARQNTYRLTARYAAVTQFLGEQAFQADIRYAPKRNLQFLVNGSYIDDLDGNLLYRELFTEVIFKKKRKYTFTGGLQRVIYNQEIYFVKPETENIKTWVPYVDLLLKLKKKQAIRFELQYMNVNTNKKKGYKVDYGDWANGLVEFTIAPHWTFTLSDMYNINPGKSSPKDSNGEGIKAHYPRFDVFYTYKTNRFSLSYVKQVEGIVCTGGICRLEPAFSGVKLSVNSTF